MYKSEISPLFIILLIEDVVDLCDELSEFLESSFPRTKTFTATNAENAINLLKGSPHSSSNPIDLIISDLRLPRNASVDLPDQIHMDLIGELFKLRGRGCEVVLISDYCGEHDVENLMRDEPGVAGILISKARSDFLELLRTCVQTHLRSIASNRILEKFGHLYSPRNRSHQSSTATGSLSLVGSIIRARQSAIDHWDYLNEDAKKLVTQHYSVRSDSDGGIALQPRRFTDDDETIVTAPDRGINQSLIADSNGNTLFVIQWISRSAAGSDKMRMNSVPGYYVIGEYETAIRDHYLMLTGSQFGFDNWTSDSPVPVSVLLISDNSGRKLLGLVEPFSVSRSHTISFQLDLCCRNNYTDPQLASRLRSDTVLHELVHCCQLNSELVRAWIRDWRQLPINSGRPAMDWYGDFANDVTRGRGSDWGWAWVLEATAYAIEAEHAVGFPEWYKELADWASFPEQELNEDESGIFAAPFLQFLLRGLGSQFASELFRLPAAPSDRTPLPDRHPLELVDEAIRRFQHLSNEKQARWGGLRAAFREYCLASALEYDPSNFFDTRIISAVGPRVRTRSFPLQSRLTCELAEGLATPMSCRFFELSPDSNRSSDATIRLQWQCPESCTDVGIALVNADGRALNVFWPTRKDSQFSIEFALPIDCVRIIITTVNGSFGPGRARYSKGSLHVEAEINDINAS
jgi:CheY-like chemotaxis protein